MFWKPILSWWNYHSDVKIDVNSWDFQESLLFGFNIEEEEIFTLNNTKIQAKKYIQQYFNDNKISFTSFLLKLKNIMHLKKEISRNNANNKFKKLEWIWECI